MDAALTKKADDLTKEFAGQATTVVKQSQSNCRVDRTRETPA